MFTVYTLVHISFRLITQITYEYTTEKVMNEVHFHKFASSASEFPMQTTGAFVGNFLS